ncbi:MAG TPA: hypothetical protein PKC39_10260 [Ferruginibacter sp.]|nr:hypothetical protein [Ferruginibacter sp.]HMP21333.1 hypothetical protein [Ferruginibacter sp.]
MIFKNILLHSLCLLLLLPCLGQTDLYPGNWQMNYPQAGITMHLRVGTPEKNMLYPAHIILQCGSFTGEYDLLLVRKNSRELAISKNKFAVTEQPFSLGKNIQLLNGTFDVSRNWQGQPTLKVKRLFTKTAITAFADSLQLSAADKTTAAALLNFLNSGEISLTKLNGLPWNGDNAYRILSSSQSPAYFGLLDTVYVQTKDGTLQLSGTKKDDVVSVASNSALLVDMLALNKKAYTEDIRLDTGLNVLVLFADNFAGGMPNKGKMNLEFGKKKFSLDFNNRGDSAAAFIAAKIYLGYDKSKESVFKDYYGTDDGIKVKPNDKVVGSIVATSRQLTLALWDDAVEDGDSVSININGNWMARGFPVKKQPQFITVTLKPGPNAITFYADNLGSIPPNTSVLEIIDGKRRRAFMLETTLEQNNLVKIFYEVQPEGQ